MLTLMMFLSLACTDDVAEDTSATDDTNTSGDDTGDTGDCFVANPPSGLTLSGEALFLQAQSAAWTAPEAGCADTEGYELALGNASETDLLDWTPVSDTAWDGVLTSELPEDTEITLRVRAIDTEGNRSEAVVSSPFTLWAPDALSGLVSWYDWSDPESAQSSGCGGVASAGQMVGCMRDKSGNANDLFQFNDGFNTYDGPYVGKINGRQAADFTGTRVLFAVHNDSVAVTTDNLTLIWVDAPARVDSSVGDYPVNKEGAYEVAYKSGKVQAAVDTVQGGIWQWGSADPGAKVGAQLNTFQYDGSTWTFRRNGEELGTMSPAGNQTGAIQQGYMQQGGFSTTETPLVIGGRPNGSTISYEAIQGELLILEQNPTPAELDTLEAYLTQKWGL